VPEQLAGLPPETLRAWAGCLSGSGGGGHRALRRRRDPAGRPGLDLIERSYASFSHPEVTPLREAGGRTYLELFHGPTAAFKDVALQLLGNLFEYLLERDGGG
jgi:threonine synthase